MNKEKLLDFIAPYYKDKDTMHDLSHIERVKRSLNSLLEKTNIEVNEEILEYALYFHGFIYTNEKEIRKWMALENIDEKRIEKIINTAWESQKYKDGISNEGKVLHDAHMVEGGESFLIVKSLVTGSARGQRLRETIKYMEENILSKGECYTEYANKKYEKQQNFARKFIQDLKKDL